MHRFNAFLFALLISAAVSAPAQTPTYVESPPRPAHLRLLPSGALDSTSEEAMLTRPTHEAIRVSGPQFERRIGMYLTGDESTRWSGWHVGEPYALRIEGEDYIELTQTEYRLRLWPVGAGPFTYRWWEVYHALSSDGFPLSMETNQRSWTGQGEVSPVFHLDPGSRTGSGIWRLVQRPANVHMTHSISRADPGRQWFPNPYGSVHYSNRVYAGNKAGDLVSFRATVSNDITIAECSPVNYSWKAIGPLTSVTGPSGPAMDEWVLDQSTREPFKNFNWAPGLWTVRCTVTFDNGLDYIAEMQQHVGWRTERYLIPGQVRPLPDGDHALTPAEQTELRDALVASWYPLSDPAHLPFAPLNPLLSSVLSTVSLEVNTFLWFLASPLPGNLVVQPDVPMKSRFWMLKYILNSEPDEVTLGAVVNAALLESLKSRASYRMLTEVQAQYQLDDNHRIRNIEFIPATERHLAGPTKIMSNTAFSNWMNEHFPGVFNGPNQVHLPLQLGTHSGAQRLADDGFEASAMSAGRIWFEGNRANIKLFNREAPFIFTEFVVRLGPDGRDTLSTINFSVDAQWTKPPESESPDSQGHLAESFHFNEISIYEMNSASPEPSYTLKRLLKIDGQLQGFVFSVAPGQAESQIQPIPAIR